MKNNITALLIKKLRERTGVGFLECKRALVEEKGDIELSIDNLRKKGKLRAEKKVNNITNHGKIFSEIRNDIGVLLELNCETDFVAQDTLFLNFGKKVIHTIFSENIKDINHLNVVLKDFRTDLITKIDENITINRFFVLHGKNIASYIHGFRIGVLVSADNLNKEIIQDIAMHITASKPEYLYPKDVDSSIIEREYKIQLELSKKLNKSPDILKKIIDGKMKKFVNSISLTGQNFIREPHNSVGEILVKNNGTIVSFVRFEIGQKTIISNNRS